MTIRKEVREIEKHVREMTSDKAEQIAIISKSQSLLVEMGLGNSHSMSVLIIAKNRIIKS